ncbi:valine--tRNA ligase, mitochondrial 1-like isoform X3 [Hordeum vulgare subsp. vulgare]|uniref:valine--tRNA ligase, mitochondrial 1-like isoform X3 n=1 Tax=Hordeum vulgare subsp. vulgare TaxID=112509 RepID=UPI001D1A5B64|nr:valine--tRNA ligase, mitochondrial 1-like isoform X3 [Hordeum vulgare subsp. vulgare]
MCGERSRQGYSACRQERRKRKSLRQIKRKRLGSRLKLLQMDLRKVTRNKGKMLRRLKILRISSIQTPLMGRRNHRQFEWPSSIAKVWYASWKSSGYFVVDPASTKPPFVMVLPPLNVTGALNIGHALMVVIEVFTVNAFTDKDSCRLSTDSHLQVVGCVKCLSCAVEVCTGYLFIREYFVVLK